MHLRPVCACTCLEEPERTGRASFSREGPNEELKAKSESEADYKATLELLRPSLSMFYFASDKLRAYKLTLPYFQFLIIVSFGLVDFTVSCNRVRIHDLEIIV